MATPLGELALLFLRLGATSFGGPAAHTAFMRDEVVRRRGWVTDQEFLDLVAATNLIPGPNSTELAMHLGRRRGGLPGLVVAGACFILPAFFIVLGVAVAYRRYGTTPDVGWLLSGILPVVIAIIADALRQMTAVTVRGATALVFLLSATTAALLGVHELVILGAAAVGMLAVRRAPWPTAGLAAAGLVGGRASAVVAAATTVGVAAVSLPVSLARLTLFFVKVGSVLFGSGYVLVAFLRADLVERWGWLTAEQLLDAVAVGQFTPGPLFTTATFIGYQLAGTSGAVLATVGIFAPGFAFVALTAPFVDRLRRSPPLSALLDGVVYASLGLMAAVTIALGLQTLTSVPRVALMALALVVLAWKRPNTAWLVLAGGAIGWVTRGLQ